MIDWNQLQRYGQAMSPWQWAFAIAVISIAIWMIVRLRSYFREDADDADEPLEMLTQFRDLHQEGGLSDDEFRLIRSHLSTIAQAALTGDQTKPKLNPNKAVPPESPVSSEAGSGDSPVQYANGEKEGKSEGMSDEKTDEGANSVRT